MAITDIRLQNFRSHGDASFEFENGVNIIVGPNASGKTNLLEAIMVVAGMNSYRASTDELVSFGSPWARLDAHTATSLRTVKIQPDSVGKTYEIDGKIAHRLNSSAVLPLCLFEPDHLLLLSGQPELRRSYLDDLCAQIFPEFSLVLRQYKRTLAQRNRLLKQSASDAQLFSWSVRLAELAGRIVGWRLQLTQKINKTISETYRSLANSKDKIDIAYHTKLDQTNYETSLLKKFDQKLTSERESGFTLYGPHRDDLIITINGNDSGLSASRGETRTIVLALKTLEATLIEEARGSKPLLLMDDVFSELDGTRRQKLTKYLSGYQTFITTTDADVVLAHFTDSAKITPLNRK